MDRAFRFVLFAVSVVQIAFALAFALQLPVITQGWPVPNTGPLSFIFIGSIFLAAAAATLWCLYVRENGALVGVVLDYIVIFVPLAIFVFQIAGGDSGLTLLGISLAAGALFGLVVLLWSRRFPINDPRPQPRLVRVSFMFFVVTLIVVGGLLVLKVPNILPWPVSPESSVIYGWMFLGAAAYFTYSLLRPSWINTGGQLAGFLAYDVVLIGPFLTRLPTIAPDFRPNLIIYTVVVIYSGLLAIYYLFIKADTRMFRALRSL